jgi:hypothetical protein
MCLVLSGVAKTSTQDSLEVTCLDGTITVKPDPKLIATLRDSLPTEQKRL